MSGPRITLAHGTFPLGPLGRAIAEGGGDPLSVDPAGGGIVTVAGDATATAVVVAQARGTDAGGHSWLASGFSWWLVVAMLSLVAAAAVWLIPNPEPDAEVQQPAELQPLPASKVAPVARP